MKDNGLRCCLFHTAIEECAYHTLRIVVMDEFSLISEMIMTAVAHSSTGNISTCLQTSLVVLYHSLHLSLSQTLGFKKLNQRCKMLEVFEADTAHGVLIGWNNGLAH